MSTTERGKKRDSEPSKKGDKAPAYMRPGGFGTDRRPSGVNNRTGK